MCATADQVVRAPTDASRDAEEEVSRLRLLVFPSDFPVFHENGKLKSVQMLILVRHFKPPVSFSLSIFFNQER